MPCFIALWKRLIDFFGGKEDLKKRQLRHTSEAFHEDLYGHARHATGWTLGLSPHPF